MAQPELCRTAGCAHARRAGADDRNFVDFAHRCASPATRKRTSAGSCFPSTDLRPQFARTLADEPGFATRKFAVPHTRGADRGGVGLGKDAPAASGPP
ncbi:hypothetical protein NMD1_01525 [Novosphingobium sp. MD-1]|nr:hypothetical protein NMD1_01525 [Novosphingobium sp. MD-1]